MKLGKNERKGAKEITFFFKNLAQRLNKAFYLIPCVITTCKRREKKPSSSCNVSEKKQKRVYHHVCILYVFISFFTPGTLECTCNNTHTQVCLSYRHCFVLYCMFKEFLAPCDNSLFASSKKKKNSDKRLKVFFAV